MTKRWKGKDWYVILAPSFLGKKKVAETPVTDPSSLTGRVLEINAADLLGNPGKYNMKIKLRINNTGTEENKTVTTHFYGFALTREHLYRMVRKRTGKVRTFDNVKTKDGWELQITSVVILNRNTQNEIKRKVRAKISKYLTDLAEKNTIESLVQYILNNIAQKNIKKICSRIYPIRFSEVEKIEVLKTGEIRP